MRIMDGTSRYSFISLPEFCKVLVFPSPSHPVCRFIQDEHEKLLISKRIQYHRLIADCWNGSNERGASKADGVTLVI